MKIKYFENRAAALLMFIFLVLSQLKDRFKRRPSHEA